MRLEGEALLECEEDMDGVTAYGPKDADNCDGYQMIRWRLQVGDSEELPFVYDGDRIHVYSGYDSTLRIL